MNTDRFYREKFTELVEIFFGLFKQEESNEKLKIKLLKMSSLAKKIFKIPHKPKGHFDNPFICEVLEHLTLRELDLLKETSIKQLFFKDFVKYLFYSIKNVFGYSKYQIQSETRTEKLVRIRRMTSILCRKYKINGKRKVSITTIGRVINKDHSTVTWSIKKHNSLIQKQRDLSYKEDFVKLSTFLFSLFKDGESILKEI